MFQHLAIFGMDVGGTLTKIMYFEKNLVSFNKDDVNKYLSDDEATKSEEGKTERKLAHSVSTRDNAKLADLDSVDHSVALKEYYDFMEDTKSGEEKTYFDHDTHLSFYSNVLNGKLHFLRFETKDMANVLELLSGMSVTENIHSLGCTGGGSHKYAKDIFESLDIKLHQTDELHCLIRGMLFALMNVVDECYTYRPASVTLTNSVPSVWQKDVKNDLRKVHVVFQNFAASKPFPYLVVNIGSGVSILKVTSPNSFERVSGTSLGGGTYWGLSRLLTRCSSYEEVLELAEAGDASEIDMLVRDIYGGDYQSMNLSGAMVASSFGKIGMKDHPTNGLREEDIAIALLMMITNNIGQIAYLVAQLHACSTIFFVGNFLRNNTISCRRLAFAISFWSSGKMEALFLEHEGYFGALGTFLQCALSEDELQSILTLAIVPDSSSTGQDFSTKPS